MSWNYRVFKRSDPGPEGFDPEIEYVIHEAYYDSPGDETPQGWTVRNVKPTGETLEDLRWVLQRMLEACDKPVLQENEILAAQSGEED